MEIKRIDLDKNSLPQEDKSSMDLPTKVHLSTKSIQSDSVMSKQSTIITIILFVVAVGAGILTGAYLKTNKATGISNGIGNSNIQANIPEQGVKIGDVYGNADEKGFKDKATGVIDKGGLNGEGTHQLVRPGGVSQTIYLTSTTIDLDQLVGHQVTIWGETFNGIKVGWLMDVGRAKVENLNVPLPK